MLNRWKVTIVPADLSWNGGEDKNKTTLQRRMILLLPVAWKHCVLIHIVFFPFFFLFLFGFGLQVFNLKADLIVVSGVFCHNGCVRFSESAGGASWHFAVTSAGCCRNESPCGTKSLPEKKFAYLSDSSRQKFWNQFFPSAIPGGPT